MVHRSQGVFIPWWCLNLAFPLVLGSFTTSLLHGGVQVRWSVLGLHVVSHFETCLDGYSVVKRSLAVGVVQRGA